MAETKSSDGRYWAIEQGDGNFVLYDLSSGSGVAVWDRWSYEAQTGSAPMPDPPPPDLPPPPPPPPDVPRPAPPAPVSQGRLLKITDPQDGQIIPRTYSYWANVWIGERTYYVFCGTSNGPAFFSVDRGTGRVLQRWGNRLRYGGETEGWYWDREGWIYLLEGPRLHRVHPFLGDDQVVVDISDSHPGCDLWQAHSSDNGRVHSATVRRVINDGAYPPLGTLVVRDGAQLFFPAQGALDESQIDASGRWVIIKEDNDNRIIDLETRETRLIYDQDGAVGHSDCGDGIVVGEDNIHGACVLWDLRGPLVPTRRRELYSTWGMGHLAIRGQRCLVSDDSALWLVDLQQGGRQHLRDHGMVGSGYDFQVKANLDPTGQVACFLSNFGSDRQDLYLLEVP